MSFENIIVAVLGLIIAGGVIAYLFIHRQNANHLKVKEKTIGTPLSLLQDWKE